MGADFSCMKSAQNGDLVDQRSDMALSNPRVVRLKDQSRPQSSRAGPNNKPGKSIAKPAIRTAVRKPLQNAVPLTSKPLASGLSPDQQTSSDEGRLPSPRVTSEPTKRWSEGRVLELGLYLPPLSQSNSETTKSNKISTPTSSNAKAAPTGGSISSAMMIPTTLKEFTLFLSLPMELRLQIWRHFAHLPRVVSLMFHPQSAKLITYHPQPVALQICRESREEALKAYQLAFGAARVFVNFDSDIFFLDNGLPNSAGPTTYPWSTVRTDWLSEPTTCLINFLRFTAGVDTQRIQNLAIGCVHKAFQVNYTGGSFALIPPDYWASHGIYKSLPEFTNLKRLIFAVEIGALGYGRRRYSSYEEALHRRKDLGRTHEIDLSSPASLLEAWQQHSVLYVDSVKDYVGRLRAPKHPDWEVPSVEMATLQVKAISQT